MEQLEVAKKKYATKLTIIYSIATAIVILFVINELISDSVKLPEYMYAIIALVALGLLIAFIATNKNGKAYRAYKKAYKDYFVEQSLRQQFTDINYQHETGIPKEKISKLGIQNFLSDYTSNDYISGKYKDVNFIQADVTIGKKVSQIDESSGVVKINDENNIFKGRYLEFEFPKQFSFRLDLIEKGFYTDKILSLFNQSKFTKYETESNNFNAKFDIYGEDGFEVYYILDPAMIEKIEQVTASHNAKYFLCFDDNKLAVAIHDQKDAFEPPNPFKNIDKDAETTKVASEIKLITDFVDYLRLDKKLFKNSKAEK